MGVYPNDKKLALHILVSEISVCASIQFAGSWMMDDGLCVVVACANHVRLGLQVFGTSATGVYVVLMSRND